MSCAVFGHYRFPALRVGNTLPGRVAKRLFGRRIEGAASQCGALLCQSDHWARDQAILATQDGKKGRKTSFVQHYVGIHTRVSPLEKA